MSIRFEVVDNPEKYKMLLIIGNAPEIIKAYQLTGIEKKWAPVPGSMYLLIYDDKSIIGFSQIRLLNTVLAEAHPAILPSLWGTNGGVQIFNAFKKTFNKQLSLKKLLIPCPEECLHVKNCLTKCNATHTGVIKDGIIYHGKLQDLNLYTLDLTDSEN